MRVQNRTPFPSAAARRPPPAAPHCPTTLPSNHNRGVLVCSPPMAAAMGEEGGGGSLTDASVYELQRQQLSPKLLCCHFIPETHTRDQIYRYIHVKSSDLDFFLLFLSALFPPGRVC